MKQLFYILSVAILLRACVAQTVRVVEESMMPSFFPGDMVLVSKVHYGLRSPGSGSYLLSWKKIQPGDLVLIHKFSKPRLTALRRVAAVPGESIKVENGSVYKKNTLGEWKLLPCKPTTAKDFCWETLGKKSFLRRTDWSPTEQKVEYSPLGENQVFLLSDNRSIELDSRFFGPITLQEIVGRASYILLPKENKWIQEQDKVVIEGIGRRKFFSNVP